MTKNFEERFVAARRKYIARQFGNMNPRQLEAVTTTQGPLLLLAGAGSGKTTVLIHRIANLIRFGSGSDSDDVPDGVTEEDVLFLEQQAVQPTEESRFRAERLCALNPAAPWSIIAITFTNKAANELKERLERMLGPEAMDVWAMTFHSACCRILRRNIDRLGYDSSFTIYDTADSERVMKEILRDNNLDEKVFAPRAVLGMISKAKDKLQSPMSPSISAFGTSAATESTTMMSIAPLRTSASVISSACSPVSGWETYRSSTCTPRFSA